MSTNSYQKETNQQNDALEPNINDTAITEMPLRSSGWVGYSDDAIFINDDELKKLNKEDIAEIGLRTLQWDIAVMSLLLVGVGGYVMLTRNPLIGLCFALVGLGSLYRTYTHRQALVIQLQNYQKPITVHPASPKLCYEQLAETTELHQVR